MSNKTKFAKTLSASNKDIKATRADMLSEEVALELDSFIGNLKRDKMALNNKIVRLTDLAPDSADSLRPASKDFQPLAWVKELHQAKMDLKLKDIELKEAEAIKTEWFTEDKTTNKK